MNKNTLKAFNANNIRVNRAYSTDAVINYMVSEMTGKLEGLQSISTSVLLNERCAARRNNPALICHECYAAAMLTNSRMARVLRKKMAFNTAVLTRRLFHIEEFPAINSRYFRIESFADVANIIQAENYVRLALANPHCNFTQWTKNPDIVTDALNRYNAGHKPKNLIIVYSSPVINLPAYDMIKRFRTIAGENVIDKLFTVYTADYAIKNDVSISCGGQKCLNCKYCYEHNEIVIVNEILKCDQKKYYAMKAAACKRLEFHAATDSHDDRRPALNIICRKGTGRTLYKLINILTPGNRPDTYVLKNIRTGKVSYAKDITAIPAGK